MRYGLRNHVVDSILKAVVNRISPSALQTRLVHLADRYRQLAAWPVFQAVEEFHELGEFGYLSAYDSRRIAALG